MQTNPNIWADVAESIPDIHAFGISLWWLLFPKGQLKKKDLKIKKYAKISFTQRWYFWKGRLGTTYHICSTAGVGFLIKGLGHDSKGNKCQHLEWFGCPLGYSVVFTTMLKNSFDFTMLKFYNVWNQAMIITNSLNDLTQICWNVSRKCLSKQWFVLIDDVDLITGNQARKQIQVCVEQFKLTVLEISCACVSIFHVGYIRLLVTLAKHFIISFHGR